MSLLVTKGYLSLVLHAHLPFVRHPEHEDFLEERWFFEALTETYIPLLMKLNKLITDKVPFKITISLSPPLLSMFADSLLQARHQNYLDMLLDLADKEVERTRWQPEFNTTALFYFRTLTNIRDFYRQKINSDLISAFRTLQETGFVYLITSAATHAFLPFLTINKQALAAQITIACTCFKKYFGHRPSGIWLPECGFVPEIEPVLHNAGIKLFFTEAHGVLFAEPKPRFGVYAPIYTEKGVAVFGRDPESSKQVWSSTEGYPGDHDYRDFYRDIGFDLDKKYLQSQLNPDGSRRSTGIKYYKIQEKEGKKRPYNHLNALKKTDLHADDFLAKKIQQIAPLFDKLGYPPILTAPYDAELFGHWWYEGPEWINLLVRKIAFDQSDIELITPKEYLEKHPTNQVCEPAQSTWGFEGYSDAWLSEENKWIYPLLHSAADCMSELVLKFPEETGLVERALNQAFRELLLAQSSDWGFIMKAGTSVEYAVKRTNTHIVRFKKLYKEILENNIDKEDLCEVEKKDNIFPEIDYKIY